MNKDINFAENNWIEIDGDNRNWNGGYADKLLNSSDFTVNPCSYSVWEVTNSTYDNRTDAVNFASILRANQSTLAGALKYMTSDNRVLIYNKAYPEKSEVEGWEVATPKYKFNSNSANNS